MHDSADFTGANDSGKSCAAVGQAGNYRFQSGLIPWSGRDRLGSRNDIQVNGADLEMFARDSTQTDRLGARAWGVGPG